MKKYIPSIILLVLVLPITAFAATTLSNPLGTTDLRIIIGRIISALLGVSGAIALLMFVWGGFQWILYCKIQTFTHLR